MATSQRIVTSNVVFPAKRIAAFSAVAKTDLSPVEEIDQYSSIINKEDPQYFESLSNDHKHETNGNRHLLETSRQHRFVSAPIISGTTESFTKAFSDILSASEVSHGAANKQPIRTSMASGIGRYEEISRVIHYEIVPLGESMNLSI